MKFPLCFSPDTTVVYAALFLGKKTVNKDNTRRWFAFSLSLYFNLVGFLFVLHISQINRFPQCLYGQERWWTIQSPVNKYMACECCVKIGLSVLLCRIIWNLFRRQTAGCWQLWCGSCQLQWCWSQKLLYSHSCSINQLFTIHPSNCTFKTLWALLKYS